MVSMQDGIDLGIDGIDDGVEIGAGGFGVVFRALQRDEGRAVAVRLLPVRPEHALRVRYERESEILRDLSGHPNIVTMYDAGFTAVDQPYLTMEYMPNGSLADRVERDGRVPWGEAVAIVAKLSDALAVAHAAGILHRDIRPENVLISSAGEPCLADLGLARLLDIVEARTAPVSLRHAAPEVVDGRRPSASADVYSLGSTLFELLAGAPAFTGGNDEAMNAVLGRIAKSPIPDLRRRGVPDAVCDVVEAAMAKKVSARPDSAAALSDALRSSLDPGADPVPPPVTPPIPPAPVVVAPPPEPVAVIVPPPPDPVPEPEPEPIPIPIPDPEPEPERVPVPVPHPAPDPEPEPEPEPAPIPDPEPPPEPSPAPPSVVTESTVIESTVIEADPDESSRSRGRLVRFGLGAVVAFVSLVILVVVLIDSSTSKVGTPTDEDTRPSRSTTVTTLATPERGEPRDLPTVLMPSGMIVARTWRLTGENGDRFIADLEVSNPTSESKTDSIIEVIPKSLVGSVTEVTFVGAKPAIVNPDPIVRYDLTLAPGAKQRMGYSITVPGEGFDEARLAAWQAARDTEQAAFDVLLSGPQPKAFKPGG